MPRMIRKRVLFVAMLAAIAQLVLKAQVPPVLNASHLYGGPGDQYGSGIFKQGPHLYLSGAGGGPGFLVKVAATGGAVAWPATPAESLAHSDVIADGANVYSVGSAYPPACGAADGVGDTEGKPLFGIYRVSDGVKTFCGSTNFYSYRGHENYASMAALGGAYFAAGVAEQFGFGGHRYVVAKYDSAGTLLAHILDPFTFSSGWGLASDSSALYVSGYRRNSSWHGDPELPFLVKLDSNLNELWRSTIDAAASGARASFRDLTVAGGLVYAVGTWQHSGGNQDFFAAKFSTSGGAPVWQKIWGSAGAEGLNDVALVHGRLFAVGPSSGGAVLVELDPTDGDVLPGPAAWGGGGVTVANRIAADGSNLYVIGYTNSFATPEGNAVGSYDAFLLHYVLTLSVTIDIKPGTTTNSINLGSGGTVPVAILSTPTFDATTVDPTTVTLAGASVALRGKGTPQATAQDVNGDGLVDLVVHVSTEALQLTDGDTQAVLTGMTYGGQPIEGSDAVRIVP